MVSAVVLERLPPERDEFDTHDYSDTMLPEGIETVHPRFAISWRNKWMIKQSDYVVTYILNVINQRASPLEVGTTFP